MNIPFPIPGICVQLYLSSACVKYKAECESIFLVVRVQRIDRKMPFSVRSLKEIEKERGKKQIHKNANAL